MERGDYVRVPTECKGAAFVFLGPAKCWEQPECQGHPADWDDPMGETVYCDGSCEEGEWVEDDSRARVRMVGDDQVFEVDADDCKPLDEDEFCHDCGQLGCAHGRY